MRAARVAGLDDEVIIHRDEWGIPHAQAGSERDAFFAQGFVQAEDRLGQLEYDRRRAAGRWAEVAGSAAVGFDAFARRCNLAGVAQHQYAALAPDARAVLDAYAAGVNAYLDLGRPLPLDLELAGLRPAPFEPWECVAIFLARHVVFANWQKKLWRGRVIGVLGPDALVRLEGAPAPTAPVVVPPGATAGPVVPGADELEPVVTAMAALARGGALDPPSLVARATGPEPERGGSNAWALAGTRTASGKPLVAGDPHRFVEAPGVYYQCHLACETFDAIGLAFVGVPGLPHFGHNRRVAWCVTNAYGDSQDLYVERFAPGDPSRYEDAGEWREAIVRHEQIPVRGGDTVVLECIETRHGPVVFGDPAGGHAVALRSTALAEPRSGLEVLAPMLRSRTVDELLATMRAWVDPVNNLVSADVDGAIAYKTVGRIPVRDRANAWGPVPGWTGAHEWSGPVPYDALPTLRDPADGLIVSANQRIVGPEYPYHLSDGYSRPDRARRLHARLDAVTDATADDMAAIHRDLRSLGADVWVDRLLGLAPADEWQRAALAVLAAWDRTMDADSAAAAVYVTTRDAVCRRVARGPLEPLRTSFPGEPAGFAPSLELRLWVVLPGLLAADDPLLLPPGSSWDDVLAEALAEAVTFLRGRFGDDVRAWRWGALHRHVPSHPLSATHPERAATLDPPPVELPGEWDTVWSTAHAVGHGFEVTSGSVARYVFDLGDWSGSAWIVPFGASGDPHSPHFADQRAAWSVGALVPMRYDWSEIARTAESTTRLRSR